MTERDEAWDAVHESLPARWQLGPPTYSPADHAWHVTARGPHAGRRTHPQTITGTGEDEIAALRDLDDRLRGVPKPHGGQMDALRRRLRLAYIQGAEEWTHRELDRGMSDAELERVAARYSGP
jgi:hypothetical protein